MLGRRAGGEGGRRRRLSFVEAGIYFKKKFYPLGSSLRFEPFFLTNNPQSHLGFGLKHDELPVQRRELVRSTGFLFSQCTKIEILTSHVSQLISQPLENQKQACPLDPVIFRASDPSGLWSGLPHQNSKGIG